jgi:RNA polymerase sigma-70 factor (ECF subfamily)
VALGAMKEAAELRALYPRVLAKTLAFTRSLADAEDAVQDAVLRALGAWRRTGRPESPEAWLVTVAANAHRDRLRRRRRAERHADTLTALAAMSPWVQGAVAMPAIARGWKDDLLRLLFACCHPALDTGESAALALATVLGLSNDEIARAFLVSPRTMEQRLVRARRRLRAAGDHEVPPAERVGDRVDAVVAALYLLFTEGHWASAGDAPIRHDLCRLALGLARSLHELAPDEPEVAGLLALLLLHESRLPARLAADGTPVPLPEQDRARWDRELHAEATAILRGALTIGRPGPLQLEAAIAAVHGDAPTADATDWAQIAALYEMLERIRPTPTVRINRAFAVAQAAGPAAGLALLDSVADTPAAALVRGVLLDEVGRPDEAGVVLERARRGARNRHEAAQIADRIDRLRTHGSVQSATRAKGAPRRACRSPGGDTGAPDGS